MFLFHILVIFMQENIVDRLGNVGVNGLTPKNTKLVFTKKEMADSCGEQELTRAFSMGLVCPKGVTTLQFFHKLVCPKGVTTLHFFHKSGQEYCSGVYLGNHPDKLRSYLKDVKTLKNVLSVAPVLIFASHTSEEAAEVIVETLISTAVNQEIKFEDYYAEKMSFEDVREIQQFIEVCLECAFEADLRGDCISCLEKLFANGSVLFYGISTKAAISLAHYLAYCSDPSVIRHVTLRPIVHTSDPANDSGPTGEIYKIALKNVNSLSSERVQKIYNDFVTANQDLHENWRRLRTPSQLVAYIPCIQACEGLPCSSETDVVAVIKSLERTRLKKLDLNNVNLGKSFDMLLNVLEKGSLESLTTLQLKSSASDGEQITQLFKNLCKVPLLRRLNVSRNKVEAGVSIPILADNLQIFPELEWLGMNDMNAPAEDMALLAEKLPPRLTKVAFQGNGVDDSVASHLIATLSRSLTHFHLSVSNLSNSKHNELLSLMHSKFPCLGDVHIYDSTFPADLISHTGLALTKCPHVDEVVLKSTCNELIPEKSVALFMDGMRQAKNIKHLRLYGIRLAKADFQQLVKVCRQLIPVLEELRSVYRPVRLDPVLYFSILHYLT